MKKKVFISGGAGVIGTSLVNLLIRKKNYEIFVGDIKDKPQDFKNKILYRKGDLNFLTEDEIKNFQPEIFIHLAAVFERTDESYNFYDNNFRNNIALSNHLLKLIAKISSIKKIIYASSYLTYDEKIYMEKNNLRNFKIDENARLNPRNLIGASKLYHEKELKLFQQYNKSKEINILRIFRGYGCGSNDVVSRWVRSALLNKPLHVYGEKGKFDYIFSEDSAGAILSLVEKKPKKNSNYIFNLGSGQNYQISYLLKLLKKRFKKIKIIRTNKKVLLENSFSSNNEIFEFTNWKPKFTLNIGLNKIINYEKKRLKITNKTEENNILISSFSEKKFPIFNYIQEFNLKNNYFKKIYISNMKKNIFHEYFRNKFLRLPECKLENNNKIFSLLKKNKIKYILPTSDLEVNFWSLIKKKLMKENIYVLISNNKTIKLCQDKYKFFQKLRKERFNVPNTSLKKLLTGSKQKFVLKERYSFLPKKISINVKKEDLKKNTNLFQNPMIQEFIKGKEYSIDFWADKFNKLKDMRIRERLKIIDGEAKVTKIVKDKIINDTIIKLSKKMKFQGIINIQGIKRKNKFYIIECNPRIGGASTASQASGMDFIRYSIDEIEKTKLIIPSHKKITQYRFQTDKIF